MTTTVYILILNIAKGNDIYLTNNKKSSLLIIIQSVFTGAAVAIIITIQNYFKYSEKVHDTIIKNTIAVAAVSFISATLGVFVILKILSYFNSKKQQRINSKLDDDE